MFLGLMDGRSRRRFRFCLALSAWVIACDGGDSAPAGETDTEGEQTGPQADLQGMVEALCEQSMGCLCHEQVYGETDCETKRSLQWEERFSKAEEAGLTFDAECVDTRIEQTQAVGCGTAGSDQVHLCQSFCSPFVGDRGAGQSCEAIDEVTSNCSQGLLCVDGLCADPCESLTGLPVGSLCMTEDGTQFDDCAQGTFCSFNTLRCAELPGIGEPCTDFQCAPGGYCNYTDAQPRCDEAATEGEYCDTAECTQGLACSWNDDTQRPVCIAPGGLGDPCPEYRCEVGLLCDDGIACLSPPREGEACVQGQCAQGLLCDWNLDICASPPAGIGQPCPQSVCAPGLWCDQSQDPEGECLPVKALAEPCTGHSQCDSGYCPRGYCLPRPGLAEDCSETQACASGLVCDGSTCTLAEARGPAVCVYDGL